MIDIWFIIGLIDAIQNVNKRYKWHENLELTLRSFKNWFILFAYTQFIVIYVLLMYYAETILGDKVYEKIPIYGTLGNALGFMSVLLILSSFVFIVLKLFETDKKIDEIKERYDLVENIDQLFDGYYGRDENDRRTIRKHIKNRTKESSKDKFINVLCP